MIRSIKELGDIAGSLGVRFLIENMPPGHPLGRSIAELADLIRTARTDGIGCCFDTGHANMHGDSVRGLVEVGPLLGCVHASDNDGSDDQHRLCFAGARWIGPRSVRRCGG